MLTSIVGITDIYEKSMFQYLFKSVPLLSLKKKRHF